MRQHALTTILGWMLLSTAGCTPPSREPPTSEAVQVQAAALRALWERADVRGRRFCVREMLPPDSTRGEWLPRDAEPGLFRLLREQRPPVVPASSCDAEGGEGRNGRTDPHFSVTPPQRRLDGDYDVSVSYTCGARCGTGNQCVVKRKGTGWWGSCQVSAIY